MPITCSNSALSLCQPMAAPGRYSVVRACGRGQAGKGGCLVPQRQEEGWNLLRPLHLLPLEVVVPAKRDHAPPARMAVELEGAERRSGDGVQQVDLLGCRDHVRLGAEPGSTGAALAKEIRL